MVISEGGADKSPLRVAFEVSKVVAFFQGVLTITGVPTQSVASKPTLIKVFFQRGRSILLLLSSHFFMYSLGLNFHISYSIICLFPAASTPSINRCPAASYPTFASVSIILSVPFDPVTFILPDRGSVSEVLYT